MPSQPSTISAHDRLEGRALFFWRMPGSFCAEGLCVSGTHEGGEIRFVVVNGSGTASMRGAPDAVVRAVIEECCAPPIDGTK